MYFIWFVVHSEKLDRKSEGSYHSVRWHGWRKYWACRNLVLPGQWAWPWSDYSSSWRCLERWWTDLRNKNKITRCLPHMNKQVMHIENSCELSIGDLQSWYTVMANTFQQNQVLTRVSWNWPCFTSCMFYSLLGSPEMIEQVTCTLFCWLITSRKATFVPSGRFS